MTHQDIAFGALCAWRENRGGGNEGMMSILNVLRNRAELHGTSVYFEATKPFQFSSLTYRDDPQLTVFPSEDDTQWRVALALASQEVLSDITGGATNYYSLLMEKPPYWAAYMERTCVIANQAFYKLQARNA